MKFFLITGLVLLLLATGAAGYIWLKLQNFVDVDSSGTQTQDIEFVESELTPIANTVPEEGITIDTSVISTQQKEVIEKVGIDLDSLVITQEMVSCVEKKLGSQRVEEILNGSSPTPLESLSILGCI